MNAAQQGTPADVTKSAYANLAPRLSLGVERTEGPSETRHVGYPDHDRGLSRICGRFRKTAPTEARSATGSRRRSIRGSPLRCVPRQRAERWIRPGVGRQEESVALGSHDLSHPIRPEPRKRRAGRLHHRDPSRWEDPLRDERKLGAVRDGLGLWEGAGIDSARTREGTARRLSEALTRPTRGCGRSRPPRGRFPKSFGLFRSRCGRLRPTSGRFPRRCGRLRATSGRFTWRFGRFRRRSGRLRSGSGRLRNRGETLGRRNEPSRPRSEPSASRARPSTSSPQPPGRRSGPSIPRFEPPGCRSQPSGS
jgi:hypothetical protein